MPGLEASPLYRVLLIRGLAAPGDKRLKQLAANRLFAVDFENGAFNEGAVDIACFGVYVNAVNF